MRLRHSPRFGVMRKTLYLTIQKKNKAQYPTEHHCTYTTDRLRCSARYWAPVPGRQCLRGAPVPWSNSTWTLRTLQCH